MKPMIANNFGNNRKMHAVRCCVQKNHPAKKQLVYFPSINKLLTPDKSVGRKELLVNKIINSTPEDCTIQSRIQHEISILSHLFFSVISFLEAFKFRSNSFANLFYLFVQILYRNPTPLGGSKLRIKKVQSKL